MIKIVTLVKVLLLFWCSLLLSSCGINSNLMFKEPKGYQAATDSIPLHPTEAYRISVDDKLFFTLAANDGKRIVESLSGVGGASQGANQVQEYVVRKNGMAEFPIIGEVKVEGLTVAACEDTLEAHFSAQYQEPFVQVKITNQRVIVFPGNGGDARVIPLINNNTTLMEAIAQAGGIAERGKARSVKVMRREGGQRKIYSIDLSTIDGLQYSDMIVQGNDYIYIEPNPELTKGVVRELAPVLSIFSSALIIFTFLTQ
ncbi:MAG: polysaccharide biosynthesis/export family protein [Bacteroidota bacterium]|jgi:polysaccharide export outer membrane protein